MTLASKSDQHDKTSAAETPARWEQRSTNRVLEGGREQLLKRSRQIVDAAYELLEHEGLEGLTIRAVLNKPGLSRRAFYERFADKDDMVLAVFEQTLRAAATHYGELVKDTNDPMERLRIIITSIVLARSPVDENSTDHEQKSNRRGAALSREHLRLAESRASDLQAALAPLIMIIMQQLADGMAVGVVRRADPQRLATLVYNLVSTTVHTALLAEESMQRDRAYQEQLAADIWEFCRRAIAV
jgi:AcrR family transcriptional regulator